MAPQVWLVTGTSSGFGTEFVKAALGRGDKVIATARNEERIAHLKDLGAATMQLDVTATPEELDRKAKEAISVYGKVDVLVNNAGYMHFGMTEERSHDEWFKQFNTNLFGAMNTTRSFLPYFRENKSGTIIFNGSMVAWYAFPAIGAYCASKAALHSAVESLSQEIAPLGIKTLLLEPGTFRTEAITNLKSVKSTLADYQALTDTWTSQFSSMNGNQVGDPTKAAELVVDIVKGENRAAGREWPGCLALGSDAVAGIRKQCEDTLRQLQEWEDISVLTDI